MLVIIGILLVVVVPNHAFAWGPATHLQYAAAVLDNLQLVRPELAAAITEHRQLFRYGNLIADLILGKHFGITYEQHSHNWDVGFGLFARHDDLPWRAMATGYLCHLATDVVAHNVLVPTMLESSRGRVRGHAYWEMRYDAHCSPKIRKQTRALQREIPAHIDMRIMQELTQTLLSHANNKRVLNMFLRLQSSGVYNRASRMSRDGSLFPLHRVTLDSCEQRSMDCLFDFLTNFDTATVCNYDPTGALMLKRSTKNRKRARAFDDVHFQQLDSLAYYLAEIDAIPVAPKGLNVDLKT